MSGISKRQVSKLCGEPDEQAALFLKRPLMGQWTYLKVRDNERVMGKAVVVAVGVTQDGRREVLGISDAHEGLTAAIAKLMGCAWQRCRVHLSPYAYRDRQAQRVGAAGRPDGSPEAAPRTRWDER